MKPYFLSKSQIQRLIFDSKKRIEEKIILNLNDYERLAITGKNYGFAVDEKIKKNFARCDKETIINYSGAIIEIKGEYTIPSVHIIDTETGKEKINLFVYQRTVIDRTNHHLAKEALKNQWVVLFPGCDEEYLYEVLSDTADEIFYETLQKKAKNLPIYRVKFDNEGRFEIEEEGMVI